MSANRATADFGREGADLSRIEPFIRSIGFLDRGERNRLVIVATEIFDNIITHSRPPPGSRVIVRVRKDSGLWLVFWFKSPDFARFAAAEGRDSRPYFDPESKRYRGLGLSMCRNLSQSIRFRHGERSDSIIIRIS